MLRVKKVVASRFWVYWLASEKLWNKKLGKKIISVIFKLSTYVDSACWHAKKSKMSNFQNSPKTCIFLEFSWTKVMRMQTFTNFKAFCHFCEVFFSKDLALAFTFFYFRLHKFWSFDQAWISSDIRVFVFPGPRPFVWSRSWPWPPICIYRSWLPICIYQPWPRIFVYRP